MPSSTSKFSLSALTVARKRYLLQSKEGAIIETPEQMFLRVATAVARAEAEFGDSSNVKVWTDRFNEALTALDFIPNSPTLMNAGTKHQQLAACFVLPVEDSLPSIFDTLKLMALVQQSGGGTGFSFSSLRAKGELVASNNGRASGPVSFMRIFDCTTENIKQGGRRRGANMGILRVDHPDIVEFIDSKRDGSFTNFNLSVAITDGFMQAVANQSQFALKNPKTQQKAAEISAPELFAKIADAAWTTGDPGLVFIDAINRYNPTPHLGEISATNPCGEVPLLPYESCNLGSINLSHMVNPRNQPIVDWAKLEEITRLAVRFLDNVIEVSQFPDERITERVRGNRKIGLGVMGFHEMLILLGVPYGSPQALEVADKVMAFLQQTAIDESQKLATVRGPFPNWERSIYGRKKTKLRNATCTSIAPTGTISILAETSPSIEPLFALAFTRKNILEGESLQEVNPLFLKYLKELHLETQVLPELLKKGSLSSIKNFPEKARELFRTALEIRPDQHLAVQSAFQKHVDNAVSKTINLPASATPEDIAKLYQQAWEMKLKGITVFRYGSKDSQVMELGVQESMEEYPASPRCPPTNCKL